MKRDDEDTLRSAIGRLCEPRPGEDFAQAWRGALARKAERRPAHSWRFVFAPVAAASAAALVAVLVLPCDPVPMDASPVAATRPSTAAPEPAPTATAEVQVALGDDGFDTAFLRGSTDFLVKLELPDWNAPIERE